MKKNPKILLVIPARYNSKRFPGKPLCYITDKNKIKKTLIERTWLLAKSLKVKCKIIIATDDERIKNLSESFGATVIMTSRMCKNGTERVSAVVEKLNDIFDIIVNLQGDALLTPNWIIEETIKKFLDNKYDVATPILKCDENIFVNLKKNFQKGITGGTTVVLNNNSEAMYFSKSIIPNIKFNDLKDYKKLNLFFHIGLYCYSQKAILSYPFLESSYLEKIEDLEQLRFLSNKIPILCVKVNNKKQEIWELNNKSDIKIIEKILQKREI